MKQSPLYVVYENCRLGTGVVIGDYSVLGKPSRPRRVGRSELHTGNVVEETIIGDRCHVGAHVIIEEGVLISDGVIIDDGAVIEKGVSIGANTYVVHGARICEGASINEDCVIGGFVADNAVIGARSRVFGTLLHRHDDPTGDWDGVVENAPRLMSDVFVGFGAYVIGGISISSQVYIVAGAIVTQSVPSKHIVTGTNRVLPVTQWTGSLRDSPFWRKSS